MYDKNIRLTNSFVSAELYCILFGNINILLKHFCMRNFQAIILRCPSKCQFQYSTTFFDNI